MSECTDKKLGAKLYAFELGLLNDEEREEFEIHLIECPFCKNRASKFSEAAELIRTDPDLRATVADPKVEKPAEKKRYTRIIRFTFAAAAILVLLILQPWQLEFHRTHEVVAEENCLAVMYFENLAEPDDPRQFGEIITNLLITDISESRYINVISSQRLYDVVRAMDVDSSSIFNKETASRIAAQLRVKWMLTGSIVQIEPNIIITTQLNDVSTGNAVISHRLTAEADDDIFSLVDKLTVFIRNDLALPKAALTESDPHIAEVTTHSTVAYHYYLEGIANLNKLYTTRAEENFREALAFDSTFAMVYYHLVELGYPEYISEALKYSDKAGQKEKMYIKSLAARLKEDFVLSERILEELLLRYPDEKDALYSLAGLKSQKGQYADAVDIYKKVLVIDPFHKMAYNQLAYTYNNMGDFENALKAVDRYIAIAPDEPNPYDTKAELLTLRGDLDQAISFYKKVLSIKFDFNSYQSAFHLGQLQIYKGEYEAAKNTFQRVVINGERFSRSLARTYLAEIPLYQGKLAQALAILGDGIVADRMELATDGRYGDRAYKHFIRSMIYAEKSAYGEAYKEMEEAIETHNMAFPRSQPAFRCMYVQILAEGGEFTKAEELTEEIKADYLAGIKPAVSAYWYSLGIMEYYRNNFELAVSYLEKCKASGNYYDFNFDLARAYQMHGNYDRAIVTYQTQLSDYLTPWRLYLGIRSVKSYYYLALSLEATGQYETAAKYYSQFLDIWKEADEGIEEINDARERLRRLENKS
ncbi:MAG: tetratricopeptide repeat protein [candidate division Zixibacteria bacterium]|nr:tetratricopeptide repeat protein [candidate division Zixibacteria bacterium]